MRILQMVPALNAGGVETGTVDISRALKRKGHEVYVMSSGGELVKELVKSGITHVTYPVHVKSVSSLLLVKTVADFIRRERIDLVHARSRVPAWIGYFASRMADCSFVTTCHGYYSEHLFSRVMAWGKEVIVISRAIGRHMIDDFGVPPERIHLIYRGVDLSQFSYDPHKYTDMIQRRPFVVTNIGRLTPIKGHSQFIKAFLYARQQIPGLEGWIVGGPDEGKEKYLEELESLVRKLGLEKRIQFLGWRRDIPEILKQSQALTLTSHVPEAFGRVVIEAGASGTVVVATQVGGVLEIIDHEQTGLLVPVDDEKELAKAWVDLYRNPEKCPRFAQGLREKVEREFSLDTMVEKTLEVYDRAVHRKKILVTKLGSLGDVILAVPSLRMIRKKFPHAQLTLLVDRRWYGLMRLCPYVNEVWTFERHRKKKRWSRLLKLAARLRKERYDCSVDLQNNLKTQVLAYLARIPKRVGHDRGLVSKWLLTHRVRMGKEPLPPVEHQFRVLALLGVSELQDALELWVNDEDRKKMDALLEEAWVNDSQRLVGFSLAASSRWPTKNWPVSRFVELARRLGQELNTRIFLLGDESALPLVTAFNPEAFPYVTNLVGKTSLQELVALVARLDVMVTGDSAPLHIAAAMQTKCVALFGPTDPKRHLPSAKGIAVFKKELPCSPCYSGKCKAKEFLCMPLIEADEVFEAVKQMLNVKSRVVSVS